MKHFGIRTLQIRCLVLHVGRCSHIVHKNLTDLLKIPAGIEAQQLQSETETPDDEPVDYVTSVTTSFQKKFGMTPVGGPKTSKVLRQIEIKQ
jgi:hypothetical protein